MAVHPLKWLFQNNLTIKEITEQHFLLNTFKIFNKQSEVAFLMQYIANALPVKKSDKNSIVVYNTFTNHFLTKRYVRKNGLCYVRQIRLPFIIIKSERILFWAWYMYEDMKIRGWLRIHVFSNITTHRIISSLKYVKPITFILLCWILNRSWGPSISLGAKCCTIHNLHYLRMLV